MSRAYEAHLEREDMAKHRLSQLAATAMVARSQLAFIRDAMASAPYCGMSQEHCKFLAGIIDRSFAEIRALEGSNASAAD